MTKPYFMTAAKLRAANACSSHTEAFETLYPDGVEVTATTLLDAASKGLNVLWLYQMLSPVACVGVFDRTRARIFPRHDEIAFDPADGSEMHRHAYRAWCAANAELAIRGPHAMIELAYDLAEALACDE